MTRMMIPSSVCRHLVRGGGIELAQPFRMMKMNTLKRAAMLLRKKTMVRHKQTFYPDFWQLLTSV